MEDEARKPLLGEEDDDLAQHELRWEIAFIYANPDSVEQLKALEELSARGREKKLEKQQSSIKKRQDVLESIRKAGLETLTYLHGSKENFVTAVRASEERLMTEAERIQINIPTKPSSGTHVVEFNSQTIRFKPFQRASINDFPPFDSLVRQRLIKSILESEKISGGADLDLEDLVREEVFEDIFPLHEDTERETLDKLWFHNHPWYKLHKLNDIPTWEIRSYLGEKTAFYFLWLSHYTLWLIPLSFLGLLASVFHYTSESDDKTFVDALYCACLLIWCDLFLEFWKRKSNTAQFMWDVRDFELVEAPRKEFVGTPVSGVYTHGGYFLPVDNDAVPQERYFSVWQRFQRQIIGAPVIVSFVGCTIIGTIALLAAKTLQIEIFGDQIGAIIAGVANAVFIVVMNIVYTRVAEKLNDFENHRTASQHEDALIIKTFLFQFVNSYISLFFIAFVKKDPLSNAQELKIFSLKVGVCQVSCMDELLIQLASLVIAKQFFSQFVEVGVPVLKRWVMSKFDGGDKEHVIAKSKLRRQVNQEMYCEKFTGTFYEYNEMLIQYGYVTLFAAAFPLAAVSSWINNVIEMRTDAYKILFEYQRSWYLADDNIGTWLNVLESVSVIAVVTNCFIVGFTSSVLRGTFQLNDAGVMECSGRCYSLLTRLTIVVAVEHLFLLLKLAIPFIIDDTPAWIYQEMAKFELEEKLEREREKKNEK